MADIPLFSQLLGFKWRDVEFPVNAMSVSLAQNLAMHKPWGKDGAEVEGTGRDSLVFTATIPFRNGVVAAKSESFGVLYPDGWRAFLGAMADRSLGYLIHPELGEIRCKPQKVDSTWDGSKRDGCDVEATWIETTEDRDGLQDALEYNASPMAEVSLAALDLDASMRLPGNKLPKRPEFKPDLFDTMRQLTAISDQVSLGLRRVTGKVDQLTYRAAQMQQSLARVNDPRNWQAQESVTRMRSALRGLVRAMGGNDRQVHYYRVQRASTLAGIAALIPARLPDLMRLNPHLLQSPVVPENTAIRHYKHAA